jgi:hypothetical protein
MRNNNRNKGSVADPDPNLDTSDRICMFLSLLDPDLDPSIIKPK